MAAFLSLGAGLTPVFADETEKELPSGLYAHYRDGAYSRFDNYVGGYSILVDPSLEIDMSLSAVCATLENAELRMQIFNQPVNVQTARGIQVDANSYISYSYRFLENTLDHTLAYQEDRVVNGREVHIAKWDRRPLLRVENDKNHYMCIDIRAGDFEIVTILIASALPFEEEAYAYVAAGFYPIEGGATPYIRRSAATSSGERNWNSETAAFFDHYFDDSAPLTWGLFEPFDKLDDLESRLDYKFPILLEYTSLENTVRHPDLINRLRSAHVRGATLELTLQPATWLPGEINPVYRILNGEYDAFLKNYAETTAGFAHPVLFRLCNEMDGDWCNYSGHTLSRDPQIYKELYRYVYGFFEEAGADNVIWIWNPQGQYFPTFTWNHSLMYYPGDAYADVIGLTLYNTGTYYAHVGEQWKSFTELYDSIYCDFAANFQKPLMITEFASASMGGDKNRWIVDMFENLYRYPRFKIAVWWSGFDYDGDTVSRSYIIDETPETMDTFRAYLKNYPPGRPGDDDWKKDTFI
ncbi:MAG: glycoside hydrolase family 26 protein [Clostridiales Family XIII bacterium]|nr:glycoside hydrolase family 26 protein [Clostridiales Family XIII bacterium]